MTTRASAVTEVPLFVAVATICAACAALQYPGGTFLTPSTHGYSLTINFFSDLGMTVAYNGQPNTLGAILFVLSLVTLVFVFGRAGLRFIRHYRAVRTARLWAIGAAVLVALACAAFIGVAVTPENSVMNIHVDVTVFAWRVFSAAALLLLVASALADSGARRLTIAWAVLTGALASYVLYLAAGPAVTDIDGLRAQVIAQKIVTVIAVAIMMYLSVSLERRAGTRASSEQHG